MSFRIIIQARLNSTRHRHKMVLPFYEGKGIFEIIANRLANEFGLDKLILSTTTNVEDDVLVKLSEKLGIAAYRGSENDVLDRFVRTAENFDVNKIVRVCADNPFIMPSYIRLLIQKFDQNTMDYLSFQFSDRTPTIRSHIGLFAELTTLNALVKVRNLTSDRAHHEHVTSFIYEHPEIFNVSFIELPKLISNRKDLRLTVDTKEDFDLAKELYLELSEQYTLETLVNNIDQDKCKIMKMKVQIEANSK